MERFDFYRQRKLNKKISLHNPTCISTGNCLRHQYTYMRGEKIDFCWKLMLRACPCMTENERHCLMTNQRFITGNYSSFLLAVMCQCCSGMFSYIMNFKRLHHLGLFFFGDFQRIILLKNLGFIQLISRFLIIVCFVCNIML